MVAGTTVMAMMDATAVPANAATSVRRGGIQLAVRMGRSTREYDTTATTSVIELLMSSTTPTGRSQVSRSMSTKTGQ